MRILLFFSPPKNAEFSCIQLFRCFFFLHIKQASSTRDDEAKWMKKLFSSSVFLFPRFNSALLRSSIVENENVTEKGMAKKSWKHFHKQPSGGREGERERAKRRICCCTSAEKGFRVVRETSRVGLLCCLHVVEATIYLDDVRLCLCRVLCLFD